MKYKTGGYVSYDSRTKDASGYQVRETVEVYTVVDLGRNSPDDCGYGTNMCVRALEAKVAAKFKVDRNVVCIECW